MKAENVRLQKEYKDAGQYANPATWPKGGVDGPFDAYQSLGIKTETEAIALSTMK